MLWKYSWEYTVSFCSCNCTLLQEHDTFYLLFLKVYSHENQNYFKQLNSVFNQNPSTRNMCISGRLWFLRYVVQETIFFFFFFFLFVNGSWKMEWKRQLFFFFGFWTIFCPFISMITWKIKILKKRKKYLEIHTVPAIQRMTDVIFIFHFGLFFAILPTCVP